MNQLPEIGKRAEAMLKNPEDLPVILDEILARPMGRARLQQLLASQLNNNLLFRLAARQAALAERHYEQWAEAEEARHQRELEEALNTKTEWTHPVEAPS